MAEDRFQLYKNYNFKVEVNGVPMSFVKVAGLERSASMQPIQEGGFNSHVHYLQDAAGGERAVLLEYGMAKSNQALTQLTPGRYLPKGVTVMVLGDDLSKPVVAYSMDGCYIRRISFGDLNAKDGGLIVNSLEIVYNYITEIK